MGLKQEVHGGAAAAGGMIQQQFLGQGRGTLPSWVRHAGLAHGSSPNSVANVSRNRFIANLMRDLTVPSGNPLSSAIKL